MDREESYFDTCAQFHVDWDKRNVFGFMRAHALIFLYVGGHFGLSVRHVSVGNPRKSLYMRPQVYSDLYLKNV